MVIVVEPTLKHDLYAELARHRLTLKQWFVNQATQFIETSRQPLLFEADDIANRSLQLTTNTPSSTPEDTE